MDEEIFENIHPGGDISGSLAQRQVALEALKNLKFNTAVNVLDGSFFGLALGFTSFAVVIPLFVKSMTDSALLLGLIVAIQSVGWQLPQIFTAQGVARQRRYRPMVLARTIHERVPFLGLALTAALLPVIGLQYGLVITFLLLSWQGLGGGFTATAWQSMIAKIIPPDRRGTFYGLQSAAANLFAAGGAGAAAIILDRLETPLNFTVLFLMNAAAMTISWFFLAATREPERPPRPVEPDSRDFWPSLWRILRRDAAFRGFLLVRILSPFAVAGLAFYTVYAVDKLNMSNLQAGSMAMVFMVTQVVLNPLMGWLADRWSGRNVMALGLTAGGMSGLLAWLAPHMSWFYLVWILMGVAKVAIWTIGLTMILEFGTEDERPAYIGLANTLIAPATIAAPFLGGWLADLLGYQATFIASAAAAALTVLALWIFVIDRPRLALEEAPVEVRRKG
jgi:MFS family permease